MKHPRSTTDDMVDFEDPITRKKSYVIIMQFGTNHLTQEVNMMPKVKKIVRTIKEIDSTRNVQLGFSGIVQRVDKDYSKAIKDINTKLKSYCLGKDLIFVSNNNIDESCLNNTKFHIRKKGTQLLTQDILDLQRATEIHLNKKQSMISETAISHVLKTSFRN